MNKPVRKRITPGPNQKCLCGSEIKYKKCCASRLPGSHRIGKDFPKLANAGDHEGALLAARADISQYTIWHQSHTARGLFDGTPITSERIWHVDIEALCEYAERLLRAYQLLERGEEMPAVLERLRNNIQKETWQQKIIFLQCLCALGEDWNVERGLREISKLGPIEHVKDPPLLAMYLNLSGDNLSLDKRLQLIDRVIEITEDDSTRIHQGVVKATLLWTHNDSRGAHEAICNVIAFCENLDELDFFQRTKYGHALFIMATVHPEHEVGDDTSSAYIERAIQQFETLLSEYELSDIGRAGIHRDLGDAYRVSGQWELALEHFDDAIRVNNQPILQLFRAECLNGLKRFEEAQGVISAISIEDLENPAEKADYLIKFSALAVDAGDRNRLQTARTLLNIPLKRDPIFQQQALYMKSIVLEAIEKGSSSSLTKRAYAVWSAIRSSIILEPNVMGFGINLNKLIDENTKTKSAIHAHVNRPGNSGG